LEVTRRGDSGAKVEGVALGLSAFGVMTADGAALGFRVAGLTDEAGALGLIKFDPVWAGREPGIGTYTPWAFATSLKVRAAQAATNATKHRTVEATTPSGQADIGASTLESATLVSSRAGRG
jgi:hypothetical protein